MFKKIIESLIQCRERLNLSQEDIAKVMKCSQSKVSKMEKGEYKDLKIRDLRAYASAVGMEVKIIFEGE